MDKYFLCNQLEEGISIDSLIQNGDTSAILVSGRRELLQRVWIQLTAHRGDFPVYIETEYGDDALQFSLKGGE